MSSESEIESLTFNQQLVRLRERKTELQLELSIEPKRADTPLTAEIQEFIKLENEILKLIGIRTQI